MGKMDVNNLSKSNRWRMILIALVVFAVIGIVQIFDSEQKIEKVEGLTFADTIEEVKGWQYEMNPGLKRAEDLGLTTNYDVEIPIADIERSLFIEKIWYTPKAVKIFYSIDLGREGYQLRYAEDSENTIDKIPTIHFLFASPSVGDEQHNNTPYHNELSLGEGVVFENRIYHQVNVEPFIDQQRNLISKVDKAVLKNVMVQLQGKKNELDDITLPLQVNLTQEVIKTIPINQESTVMDTLIRLERLELGTIKNNLYFRVEHPDRHRVQKVNMLIRTDFGEKRGFPDGFHVKTEKDGLYVFSFPTFESEPHEIEFELKGIQFIGEDHVAFSIDTSRYTNSVPTANEKHVDKINRKIGGKKNTDLIIEELIYDRSSFIFSITYQKHAILPKPYVHLVSGSMKASKVNGERSIPLLVSALNEKKERPHFNLIGSRFIFSRIFVEKAQRIDVRIENLLYEMVFDWKIKTSTIVMDD
jgi:hypothetical protein